MDASTLSLHQRTKCGILITSRNPWYDIRQLLTLINRTKTLSEPLDWGIYPFVHLMEQWSNDAICKTCAGID